MRGVFQSGRRSWPWLPHRRCAKLTRTMEEWVASRWFRHVQSRGNMQVANAESDAEARD